MSVTGPITRERVLAWAKSVPPYSRWWVDDSVVEAAAAVVMDWNTYVRFPPDPRCLSIYTVKLCRKSYRKSVLNTLPEPRYCYPDMARICVCNEPLHHCAECGKLISDCEWVANWTTCSECFGGPE